MSGRAVEASGDVDVILLDKTGTITYGNRLAASITAGARRRPRSRRSPPPSSSSIRDETPEGRSIVELARKRLAELEAPGRHRRRRRPRGARRDRSPRPSPSGPRPGRAASQLTDGTLVLKGAVDAIAPDARRRLPAEIVEAETDRIADPGATPLAIRRDGRVARPHRAQGHGQGRPRRALRRVPQDGHPDGDDHRRQPADGGDDRPRGRRRRLHRRGHARGQDRLHPQPSRPRATSWR